MRKRWRCSKPAQLEDCPASTSGRSTGGFLKYLRQDGSGVWQWDPYRDYLEQIQSRLPLQVAAFAIPPLRYSLESPHSLHDAWLESLEIVEPAKGKRHEERSTRITLQLLGAFHDRVHELVYLGVRRYRVGALNAQRGHGDLIVHEVRLEDDDLVVHELLFANGATIEIGCSDFFHTERPCGPDGP